MYIKLKWILILIIGILNQTTNDNFCTERFANCLLCRSNECKICDQFLGFVLNSSYNCVRCSIIQNCQFYNNQCQCQVCNSNFDLCNGKCKSKLPNCRIGNSCINNCFICNDNYYINNRSCTQVTNLVENCLLYQNNTCTQCKNTYDLSSADNVVTCSLPTNSTSTSSAVSTSLNSLNSSNLATTSASTTSTTLNNCLINSGITNSCNSCIEKENFTFYQYSTLNPFKTIESRILQNNPFQNASLFSNFQSFNSLTNMVSKNNLCLNKTVENCLIIKGNGSFECILCDNNSILQSGICIRYTQNNIPNCNYYGYNNSNMKDFLGYTSLICTECNSGYFLYNTRCIQYTNIDGCTIYNLLRTSCLSCNNTEGFKLNNGSCSKIINFIKVDFCNSYNITGSNEGKCSSCLNTTEYNLFQNTCTFINNCSTVLRNLASGLLTCTSCKEEYYLLNSQTCKRLDSNSNCLVPYNNSPTQCSICKASLFPNSSRLCSNLYNGFPIITNCERGGSNYNCNRCLPGFNVVGRIYQCMNIIPNCLYYDNSTLNRCKICEKGKIIDSTGRCNNNPTNITQDCEIYNSSSVCISCISTKILVSNNCITATIGNSEGLCKNQLFVITNNYRINSSPFFRPDSNSPTLKNYCNECINNTLAVNPLNREQCLPRLNPNSTDLFKDDTCSANQIRVRYIHQNPSYNPNRSTSSSNRVFNQVSSCRPINSLLQSTRFSSDPNCHIFRNNLDLFTNFTTAGTTLCTICKSGFFIQSNRCTIISECNPDANVFGGCSSCSENFQLDISGNYCSSKINNCKVISNGSCLECSNGYYGVISSAITYTSSESGSGKLLGLYGERILLKNRDSNNIKISKYKWFFYDNTNTLFKFTECRNTQLFSSNINQSAASTIALTSEQQNRVLAVVGTNTYASYCKKNNYIYLRSVSNIWYCDQLQGSSFSNLIDNNFLNQAVGNRCSGSLNYAFSRGTIGGPYCFSSGAFSNDPLRMTFTARSNCQIHLLDWTNKSADANQTNLRCLFCTGNNYTNSNGTCDSFTNAATDIVTYCLYNINGICRLCPIGMSIVNNSCVNSSQLLWTGGQNITNFLNSKFCKSISWATNIQGYKTAFTLGTDTNVATCLECRENYVMNYENYHCFWKNKFNFNNCLSTQHLEGCIACDNQHIRFSFYTNTTELCINNPIESDYYINTADINCSLYNFDSNSLYRCIACNTGFTLINHRCISINIQIANCKQINQYNKCVQCNDWYYPSGNVCLRGNIPNCLSYSSSNRCSRCIEGYIRNYIQNATVCLSYNFIKQNFENCDSLSENSDLGYPSLYCNCLNNIIPLNLASTSYLNNTFCVPINNRNCLHRQAYTLSYQSAAFCEQCNSDLLPNGRFSNTKYILRNSFCFQRSTNELINNCIEYLKDDVRCISCDKSYYLFNNKCVKVFKKNDNLDFCKYSINQNICLLCEDGFYFSSNNICSRINPSKLILNCYKYNDQQNCIICNRGYLFNTQNNRCDILNDNTFLDINNTCMFNSIYGYRYINRCDCINNYYFDNESKSCKTIENCIKLDNFGICQICNSGMYYNGLNCVNVNNLITNCLYYKNNNICRQCSINYSLVNNECVRVDSNDIVSKCNSYDNNLKCILCSPGYFNNNGVCNITLDSSFYYSSSSDSNVGLICKKGYEMDINRLCIKSNADSTININNNRVVNN